MLDSAFNKSFESRHDFAPQILESRPGFKPSLLENALDLMFATLSQRLISYLLASTKETP
jgi:hypothetical protein